ncbi:MAG: hypothetical protein C0518_00635 [Opitutus sp.]|nr:hypothetical protein [Opitutus sp.]
MNLRPAVSVLVLLFGTGGSIASPVSELALPERAIPALDPILKRAAEQSPRMVSRALDLEMAENNRIQARAGLLPTVNASYRLSRSRDDRADLLEPTDATKTYYDVSVTQPLFHWGERRNSARIGEIQQLIAEGNYREGYRQLVQELRQKYVALTVQKTQRERARAFLGLAQQQLALAEERLTKKVISEVEIYPIRLNAEQAQIGVERAEYDFESAKHTFARLAGMNALTDAQIPDAVPPVAYTRAPVNALLSAFLAQKNIPSVEAANLRHMLEIEALNVKNQQTRLRPKAGAVLGLNQDEQSYSLNTAQKYRVTSMYAGVQINWTIFDGFAAQAGTRSALARRRQIETDYAQVLDRLGQQAQSLAKQMDFAARAMSIADRGLASGEGNLRTKQGEFQRGSASETDVAQAGIQLLDARIGAYVARLDYLTKVGEFLGTLNEDPVVAALSIK